jgi:amino acid adenylation domain-containing protein
MPDVASVMSGRRVRYSPERVHSRIERQARSHPDRPAVVAGTTVLTYGTLNARANQLARHLRALGVGSESPVGTCLNRSPDAVVSALGIVKAGAAPVLLDPAAPTERTLALVRDSGAAVLVTSATSAAVGTDLLDALAERGVHVVRLDADAGRLAALPDGDLTGVSVAPQSAAHIVYTSGSTGTPKGVVSRHETVSECVELAFDAFGFTADDRATWTSSPGFGVSLVNELWPVLSAGGVVHIPAAETLLVPDRLRDWLVDTGITVVQLPGTLAAPLCELDWPRDHTLRLLLTTGERFRLPTGAGAPFEVVVTYGSTETTHITAQLDLAAGRRPCADGEPTTGWPAPNTSVYLLDEEGAPVPEGDAGVVHVAGTRLARGYLGDAALTAAHFLPDPHAGEPGARMYRTGDLGRVGADGRLTLVGRVDRQVKIRAVRVNLDEVEAVVARQTGVAEAAVVTVGAEPRIVAYVAGVDGTRVGELHRALAGELTPAQLPAEFVLLDRLPRTVNGKLDRAALPEPRRPSREPEPRADDDEIVRIWRTLLERDDIGVDDGFFELGGHSLLAVRMVLEVQEHTGVRVDLAAFYDRPTVNALSGLVSAARQPENLLVRPRPRPDAPVRLVCFPYAGGGIASYAGWVDDLPEDVDLVCVQPPGRGARLTEPPLWWLDELVMAVGPRLAADPHPHTVLFGHSLGAVVAFEVARWLRRNGHAGPSALMVAGSAAPQLPTTAQAHLLPDGDLLAHIGAMGGTDPALLADERLHPVLLPALRADFAMHENYHYRADEPLDCPIIAYAGKDDPEAPVADALAWREQTTTRFHHEILSGGHFFIADQRARLLSSISGELMSMA